MTYQVIARKWRPQTFEEVTGQEHITRTLRNAVEHERLHHAYLFSGARGVGKTTTARLLAKAVNCHRADRPTPTPCRTTDPDACPSCREVADGRSIDVMEIDAASNTGVDNVRDAIINTVGTRPARDRYKVFIIDEVHMLSTPAFNALLKTLEEPPPRVLFIMATTHAHKIPETILSRSQQFEFRTISAVKIAERLRLIADAEKIEVTDDALKEVARAGEGSMRDAQSAFDQVISFSEGKIETADVEAALGIAGRELLSRVMRAVAAQKPAEALAVVDELAARGHELRNFCRDLMAHLRDLLVVRVAGDSAQADATEAERRALVDEARDFSESDLVRFFHSLTETEGRLRESAHPRYQLEVGLVKLVEMRRLAPLGRIVERLNALEESLRTGRAPAGGAGTPPAPAAPPVSVPPRRGMAGGGGGASSFSPSEAVASSTEAFAAPAFARPAAQSGETDGARATVSPPARGRTQAQASPAHASTNGAVSINGAASTNDAASTNVGLSPDIGLSPDSGLSFDIGLSSDSGVSTDGTASINGGAPNDSAAPNSGGVPDDGGMRPAATPNLKLVPPPVQSGGGAPSFAGDAASRAADAPFPLADGAGLGGGLFDATRPFVEGARAGEDRVGRPVSFMPTTHASAQAMPSAQATPVDASDARVKTDELRGRTDERPPAPVQSNKHTPVQSNERVFVQSNERPSVGSDERTAIESDDPAAPFKRGLEERGKPLLAVALDGARRVTIEADEVCVEFAPEGKHLRDTLMRPEHMRLLREVCCESLGRGVGVAVRMRAPGEAEDEQVTALDEARRDQRLLRERAEGHPVVQQVLKTFRAEIVDVRRSDGAQPQ
ncbi:MAG: polymerase subunit gamma/tau [Acidobacteriota bacterium]|nr:polymerase subunit gamma/tau [Acidobacteriota bacterium]